MKAYAGGRHHGRVYLIARHDRLHLAGRVERSDDKLRDKLFGICSEPLKKGNDDLQRRLRSVYLASIILKIHGVERGR
jgi:hypothetical protein